MRRTSLYKHKVLNILFVWASLLVHLSNAQECNFCEGNITNPTVAFTGDGYVTCADVPILIDIDGEEKDCYKDMEKICCPSVTLPDPCIFCEGGVTNPFLMVPPDFEEEEQTTCSVAQIFAASFSREEQMCGIIKREEKLCCPPSLAPTMTRSPSIEPTSLTTPFATRSPTVEPTSLTTLFVTNEFVSLSPAPPQVPPTEMDDNNPLNLPAVRSSTISGIAFYDVNNNGFIENLKEYGMWNIQVSLFSCGDDRTILATTSTSTQGTFQLENLAEGSYYVKFDYPSYYTLGNVWNGDPLTSNSDNFVNPENGVTNCFMLGDGDQFEANVALTIKEEPVPPPTSAAPQPLPTIDPITAAPVDPITTAAPPTIRPTEADIITTTSSPTAQSMSDTVMCAFCENGIPDIMLMLPKGITCGSVKEAAAGMKEGSDICNILREEETLCCPEFIPPISTLSPTDTPTSPQVLDPTTSSQPAPDFQSDICTFCESGIIDLGFRGRQGGTCGSQKDMANSVNGLSPTCTMIQELEDICCPSKPVLDPCAFCQEGVPDPLVIVTGGQTCGAIQKWAAFFSVDSMLCLSFLESESKCCPGLFDIPFSPTLMPAVTNSTTLPISPTQPTNVTDTANATVATNVTDSTNVTNATNATVATNATDTANVTIATNTTDLSNVTDTTNATDVTNETEENAPSFDYTFDLGLDFELIGPVTTTSIDMTLIGVEETEEYKAWQTTTANFIMDYFKDSEYVYDVNVEVAMQFETVTAIARGTDTGNAVQRRNHEGRQLEDIVALKITYNQITSYKSEDPSIYDETYIVEEPFRGDPEGYIAQLKKSSANGAYDAVIEVAVGVPAPAPPPTFKPVSVPSVKEATSGDSMLYIIIGAACGVVLIVSAAGILILRRRLRRSSRTVSTGLESVDDDDLQNRDMNGLLVVGAGTPSTMSDGDEEEILPSGEVRIHILAPKGRLGITLVNLPEGGPPYVTQVSRRSPLFGMLQLGDRIVAVDRDDVQLVSARNVKKLLARKKRHPQRQLTILREGSGREVQPDHIAPYSHEGNNHTVDSYASQYTDSDYTVITVVAPMGTLGLFVEDSSDGGPPIVSEIARGSVLEGEIELFDRIASIDGTDVRGLKALHVSKLLAYKSRNMERKIVALREKNVGSQNRFMV